MCGSASLTLCAKESLSLSLSSRPLSRDLSPSSPHLSCVLSLSPQPASSSSLSRHSRPLRLRICPCRSPWPHQRLRFLCSRSPVSLVLGIRSLQLRLCAAVCARVRQPLSRCCLCLPAFISLSLSPRACSYLPPALCSLCGSVPSRLMALSPSLSLAMSLSPPESPVTELFCRLAPCGPLTHTAGRGAQRKSKVSHAGLVSSKTITLRLSASQWFVAKASRFRALLSKVATTPRRQRV